MKYDVIVIGAGPAGSAAAFSLCSLGLKTLIIDKCIFPRRKLCGGMITLRAKKFYRKIFIENFNTLPTTKSYGCEFYYKYNYLNSVRHYRELYFTNREEFDLSLLQMVKSVGATILEGSKVVSINKDTNEVVLNNSKTYQADFIIGADGIHSRVSKSLFKHSFNHNSCAIALKVDIDKTPETLNPKIYFGDFDWSNGWVFPKKDKISVGLVSRLAKVKNIKANFLEFLKNLDLKVDEKQITGFYSPFGDYKKTPGYKNIILCGDASGLVDPLAGDGISYALQSGYLAAISVKETIGTNNTLLNTYKKHYKEITKNLDYANLLKYLLFSKSGEKMLVDNLSENNQLLLMGFDLISDEIEYKKFFKYISKEFAQSTISKFI